jgi:hypothetical protein
MKDVLLSQYEASLGMLEDCVGQYDDGVWLDGENYSSAAWRIAYHVIFFANIYSCAKKRDIKAWAKETAYYQNLGKTAGAGGKEGKEKKVYSQDEMLEYLEHARKCIPDYLEGMIAEGKCWPSWYSLSQFEFHLNNIRHIQHHTAQLIERHSAVRQISVEWSRS